MDSQLEQDKKRIESLRKERASWISHWREIGDNITPRRFRFNKADKNSGQKKTQGIINNKPTKSARTLASGMMAGITSPARPWFRLTTSDPGLMGFGPVREYLETVEDTLRSTFAKSNVYNALHSVYGDLGAFGTSVLHIEEDFKTRIRAYVFPLGQFFLGNSDRQEVDTVGREFAMTAGQLVQKFGLGSCSEAVKTAYTNNAVDTWFDVIHLVTPNKGQKMGQLGPSGMAFRSCWFEASAGVGTDYLDKRGFHEFPCMAPRWMANAEDVYGSSPGMEALGDVKALQLLERRKAQAVDKIINPPMRAPSSLMHMRSSLLPGDVTYVDGNAAGQTFAPAIEINPSTVTVVESSIREHEQRVEAAFYADLWLMMANSENTDMTAREVSERHEEKMLQLGPVMERLEGELLSPLIDRVYAVLQRAGLLPKPPPELMGQDLPVEYISIMAQAQKMLGTSSIERLSGFVGNLVAVKPEVLDNIDMDKMIETYADNLGVPANLIVDADKVEAIRAARAQQAQAQQMAQSAMVAANGAKTLSQADTGSDNALTRILGNLGGVAGASAGGGGQPN